MLEQILFVNYFILHYLFEIMIMVNLNAVAFIPLGHLVARLMMNCNTLKAYSYDLIGAILGIIFFTTLSFLWTGPIVWLLISFTVLIFLQLNLRLNIKLNCISLVILILSLNTFLDPDKMDLHSPYQNVSLKFSNQSHSPVEVKSNNLWLQTPINLSDEFYQKLNSSWHKFYIIPYVSTKKKMEEILHEIPSASSTWSPRSCARDLRSGMVRWWRGECGSSASPPSSSYLPGGG
jgi:hypothetical protein